MFDVCFFPYWYLSTFFFVYKYFMFLKMNKMYSRMVNYDTTLSVLILVFFVFVWFLVLFPRPTRRSVRWQNVDLYFFLYLSFAFGGFLFLEGVGMLACYICSQPLFIHKNKSISVCYCIMYMCTLTKLRSEV